MSKWILLLLASGCFTYLIAQLLPSSAKRMTLEHERLLKFIGYRALEKQAEQAGMRIKLRDYGILLLCAVGAGYLVSRSTGNYMYVYFAGLLGFCVPKYILSNVQYYKRRKVLLNLPGNLRLLTSQFSDSKSILRALDRALPMMNGETKPAFERLLQALKMDMPLKGSLIRLKQELNYRKMDDYCEILCMGHQEGFHGRTIDSLREIIEDMIYDIRILNELDIVNRKKRVNAHVMVLTSGMLLLMFRFMESQMGTPTLDEPLGKVLLGTLALAMLYVYFARDKYLRLNLNDL